MMASDVMVTIMDDDTDSNGDGDIEDTGDETGAVPTPRLSITPTENAFARPETVMPVRGAQQGYMVSFTADTDNQLVNR